MAGRIVLFGATGYTGRLVAQALVARGARPLLIARGDAPLRALAGELGGLEFALADVERPESVRALLEAGDVLISCVGPFARWGAVAVEAAIDAGAHYIDSTGEPSFIRRVFEQYGPRARDSGLLCAFGYDWVPGNLAAGLALREAGTAATRVQIGYFISGAASLGMSGGTRASLAGVMLEPGYAWRDGRLQTERGAKRVAALRAGGRTREGVSVASSEHLALPRIAPQLREVDVYLGWFGPASRPMQALSALSEAAVGLPGVRSALTNVIQRSVKGSTGGPDATERAKSGSLVVAHALDSSGVQLATVELEGPNGYTFTGDVIGWAARAAAAGALSGTGALGPVDGFGLDALEAGCAEVGMQRTASVA